MNEPDWQDGQNNDGAAQAALWLGSSAHSSGHIEFAMNAQFPDAWSDQGEPLTEVWEYLGKH